MNQLATIKKYLVLLAFLFINHSAHAVVAQDPLFLVTSVDPNVLFNMSVETPMGGAAYNDQPDGGSCSGRVNDGGTVGVCYFRDKEYLGYFDPNKCYNYSTGNTRFNPSSDTINEFHECSGKYSGNFLNWATMTAMDMFVWTMTGGNRIDDGADNTTVIRRVRKQNNDSWFPHKLITASRNVAPSTVTPWGDSKIYIENTSFGVEFGTSRGANNRSGSGAYDVDIRLCNKNKTLEDNCISYSGGNYYKPEGLIQENANSMRFAVTSYSNTNGNGIDGGVLRSNMKYIGTTMPDGSGNTITNPNAEVLADGTFDTNPNPSDATASGVSYSGVITYLNKFSDPGYKSNDPASELFYESLRYYKNLGPTTEYLSGAKGGFPIIGASDWEDPIQYWCQNNFIIGMNDANPWKDKKLPGTFFTSNSFNGESISDDYGQPSNPDTDINVTSLTNTVGNLEGLTGTNQYIGCTAASCDGNSWNQKNIPGLGQVFGTHPAAQKENSYYIAGLAYYANTEDIRTGAGGTTDFQDSQTVSTFMIDSQEYSSNPLTGPMNMLWLAGKYGGFIDENGDGDPNNGATPSHASPAVASDSTSTSEWDADGDNSPDNYVLATEPDKLVAALNAAFDDIIERTASSTSVGTNSSRIDANSKIYQASFNSGNWTGQLHAYDLNTGGVIGSETWEASSLIPSEDNRNIFSYNPAATGDKGIVFEYANLNSAQQALLNTSAFGITDSLGDDRVDYIRGDQSNEELNSGEFRDRTSLLGDIVNSDPWFVGTRSDFGYSLLAGTEGSSYINYRSNKLLKTPVLYFGANDGMLHAIDATTEDNDNNGSEDGGGELFAYVPDTIITSLNKLTTPFYGCSGNGCISHSYFVDGAVKSGDAYIDTGSGNAWHTVLLGNLGGGGKGIFALDVTSPSTFSAANVMWEISTTQSPDNSDLSDFQNNLGYTLPQASVVKMHNGKWAAIVSNGYESNDNKAVLFIIDIETGEIIKMIDTDVGDAGLPNGLSTPTAVDADGDKIVDAIYAGDLQGNLWKFDVTASNPNQWDVAFKTGATPTPLFIATDSSSTAQAITAKPQIGEHPEGGLMIYFGTGKYYAVNDQIVGANPQVHTFYGINDKGAVTSSRNELQQQQILDEATLTVIDEESQTSISFEVRATSDETVNYPTKKGWYIDLISPIIGAEGERVISAPVLEGGSIIFSTLIPDPNPCGDGVTSWLMELDAINGSRLDSSPYDFDGDGVFDIDDLLASYDTDGDGNIDASDAIAVSGVKLGKGQSVSLVGIDKDRDLALLGSVPGVDSIVRKTGDPTGRQSWRQLR